MNKYILFFIALFSCASVYTCGLFEQLQESQIELRSLYKTIKKTKRTSNSPRKRDDNLLLSCSEAIERYEKFAVCACEKCHQTVCLKSRHYINKIHAYFGIE